MAIDFWIVDTFSKKPLSGSPSAVVFMDDFSDEHLMQNIAMELNVPETAFIRSFNQKDFEISCFCPVAKGIFFGNGLFAATHILSFEKKEPSQFNLVIGSRIFEAAYLDDGLVKITLSTPEVKKISMPEAITRAFYGENIVSVGESKNALIVEVRSPKKIANLTPNTDILRHIDQDMVIVTADSHYETDVDYDFCTRVYAPKFGIVEDRVTPLAHSRLVTYWKDRMEKNEFVGYQDSKNGGYVRAEYADKYIHMYGYCIAITKGVLFL